MAKIERIKCGNGNCFLIHEKNNAVLVDTSQTQFKDKILDICKDKNIKLIVLTHGHVDHIQNAAYLSIKLNVPIAMNKADYDMSKNNKLQLNPSLFLKEGDSLENYGINATIVELPGHTEGSIGVMVGNTDFIVGDALMNIFYPSKSMLYNDRKGMEASASKVSNSEAKMIHFGHGNSIANRVW